MGRHPRSFRLSQGGEAREVSLAPALSVNDLDILHDAVLGGVGVAMLPAYRCADDIHAGRLERVLPDWETPAQPVHALYPSGRHLSPKVKAMLDHLQQMTIAPWVPGGKGHSPPSATDTRSARTRQQAARRNAKASAEPSEPNAAGEPALPKGRSTKASPPTRPRRKSAE
jgi:hypothetical protein